MSTKLLSQRVVKQFEDGRSEVRKNIARESNEGHNFALYDFTFQYLDDKGKVVDTNLRGIPLSLDGKDVALIRNEDDRYQDMLVDISGLSKNPVFVKDLSPTEILPPKPVTKDLPLNGQYIPMQMQTARHEAAVMISQYADSLHRTTKNTVRGFAELKGKLDLPSLDDPTLSKAVSWAKHNKYNLDEIHDLKHLMLGASTAVSNVNYLLDKQIGVLPNYREITTIEGDSIRVTDGGLDALTETISRNMDFVDYGLRMDFNYNIDEDCIELILTNHRLEEVCRIKDFEGFQNTHLEINDEQYEIAEYLIDGDCIDELIVEGKMNSMTPELRNMLEAISTHSENPLAISLVKNESDGRTLEAYYWNNNLNGITTTSGNIQSSDLLSRIADHHDNFSELSKKFSQTNPHFAIRQPSQKREFENTQESELSL